MIRRNFMKMVGAIGAVSVISYPMRLIAASIGERVWPEEAMTITSLEDSIRKGVGTDKIEEGSIDVGLPPIAENGAVVPVTITCNIDNVETIHLVVDKNPEPYICRFYVGDAGKAEVSTRIKMGETSLVRGIAVTKDGKAYQGSNSVRVVVGGCGA